MSAAHFSCPEANVLQQAFWLQSFCPFFHECSMRLRCLCCIITTVAGHPTVAYYQILVSVMVFAAKRCFCDENWPLYLPVGIRRCIENSVRSYIALGKWQQEVHFESLWPLQPQTGEAYSSRHEFPSWREGGPERNGKPLHLGQSLFMELLDLPDIGQWSAHMWDSLKF